jgi:hypothetical protein
MICANSECNKEFIPHDKRQIYCSKSCAQKMSTYFRTQKKIQSHKDKTCLICNTIFKWQASKKYCSAECAKKAIQNQCKKWQQDNIAYAKELKKNWNTNNKQYLNLYEKQKKKQDPNYKLSKTIRSRIGNAIINQSTAKAYSSIELLGCSIEECRKYLESKFQDGMTWENHGQFGWHIDHIIPCDMFNLTDLNEQKKCFHYTNLQPLWWIDNLKKGNKIRSY